MNFSPAHDRIPLLCVILIIVSATTVFSQNRIINSSGNWSNTGIWVGGNRADVVTEDVNVSNNLGGTGIVTVDARYGVGYVDLGSGNDLLVNSNITLTIGNASNPDDLLIGNNSVLTVNANGNVIVWDDLIIDSDGIATINVNGTITVRGDLILSDNSSLTLNGSGVLTVLGDVRYEDVGADLINNATLNASDIRVINGDNGNTLTNDGTVTFNDIDLGDGDFALNNSGTLNQTGDFLNADAGSAFQNLTNATWNFSGTQIDGVRLFAGSYPNTFNYNRAGDQDIISPQDAYSHIILSNSGTKSAPLFGTIQVKGNWTRTDAATFQAFLTTIVFSGTVSQAISAVGGETFTGLTIDNSWPLSPQLSTDANIFVAGTLTMSGGNLDLNGNTLQLGYGTDFLSVGYLDHSEGWLLDGTMTRYMLEGAIATGSDAGLLPVGTDTDYRPFLVGKTNLAGSAGAINVTYTNASSATDLTFTDNTIPVSGSTVTVERRHNAFWSVSTSGLTDGLFDIQAGGTGFIVSSISDVRVTKLSDATNIGTATATSGTINDVLANRTGLTYTQLNNNFYLASLDATDSPLPIELAYFRAELRHDKVVTTWKTTREKDNHFFTIQKTTDFETIYDVGRIDGQGTTLEETAYEFVDDSPIPGRSYYRLKQTDYDGKFSFSEPIMIEYGGLTSLMLQVYPNPLGGNGVTVEIRGPADAEEIPACLYDSHGHMVMEFMVAMQAPGIYKTELVFPAKLMPGLYMFKAGRTLQLMRKIVVY